MNKQAIRDLLEQKFLQYNRPDFIPEDPIVIPHGFSRKQDIEISGFFAAILAWGQRKTIINKSNELMDRMDRSPYDFVRHHTSADLQQLMGFKHRTFNDTDLLYCIAFFKRHYTSYDSLEDAFVQKQFLSMENTLSDFRDYFFRDEFAPARTAKHVASPSRKSACKRLNMFLRWMVRTDGQGVDFGIWKKIPVSQLICPCDLHVERVARKLGLIHRKQMDWQAAMELTSELRKFDAADPVKYDYALFGLGVDARHQDW